MMALGEMLLPQAQGEPVRCMRCSRDSGRGMKLSMGGNEAQGEGEGCQCGPGWSWRGLLPNLPWSGAGDDGSGSSPLVQWGDGKLAPKVHIFKRKPPHCQQPHN